MKKLGFLVLLIASFSLAIPAAAASSQIASVSDGDTLGGGGKGG